MLRTMNHARFIQANFLTGVKKEPVLSGMDMILRYMGDGSTADIPILPIEGKRSSNQLTSPIVLFPGVEGVITVLEPLYQNLEGDLVGLQYPTNNQKDSVEEMAATYLPVRTCSL